MSSISRSSLCRIVRQRSNRGIPSAVSVSSSRHNCNNLVLTSYSRGFSTITIEQTLQQTHLDTKADESNFQKNARAELIQALDNVIQVNKSLGLSNVNVSSSNNNNKRANNLDGENRKKRIASWKKSINRALSKNDIPLATELFYAPPVMVNDNIDISLLGTYNNFISRLRPQKLGLMIDVYHRFEELYSNAQEISDGELPKGITTKRQTLLNKLIKAIGAARAAQDRISSKVPPYRE